MARETRARTITLFAVVALVATLLACHEIERRSDAWVQQSRQVARLARTALSLATDEETGVRGYLLARDTTLLVQQKFARARLPRLLAELTATVDDTAQLRRARVVGERMVEWQRLSADPALRAPHRPDDPAARARWTQDGGRRFDAVRAGFQELIEREDAEYALRLQRKERIRLWGLLVLLVEILAITGASMLSDRRLLSQAQDIMESNTRLEEQAVELEITMEEAQRSSTDREEAFAVLDAALGSAPQAFAFFDEDGRVVHRNRAFDALLSGLGATPGAVEFLDATGTLAPLADTVRRVRNAAQPQSDVALETHHVDEEGNTQRRTWSASYYPVWVNGRALGVGLLATDVTAQLRLEAELRQSQKMDAIGQLAGSVAHDFNNVLTVITSYADMLLMDMPPSPERLDVERIVKAAGRAASLTKQLLTFSRKETLQPAPLEVTAVVRGLEEMLRRLIGEEVEVLVIADEPLPEVVVDQGQLEQVIVNLAVNARDAMPEGGTLLLETSATRISQDDSALHPGLAPGAYVLLTVSDTGVGMDSATRARVFEPYFTTKARGQGTGIGLATVYGIVRQARGHIALYSEPGEGTTVRVWLPVADAEVRTVTPVHGVRKAALPGKSQTVLVADDDDSVREAVVRVLQRRGYTVLTAQDGAEALALCAGLARAGRRVDLLISDVIMPGMSGPALVEEVRALMGEVRVLFMSGYTGTHLESANLPAGLTAFIEKPFTVDVLLDKVSEVFEAPPVEVRLWSPEPPDETAPQGVGRAARDLARRAVALERRAAATTQRSMEARHRTVLDALQEGVVLIDAAGVVQMSNPSADRALGAARSIVGQRLEDLPVTLLDESGAPFAPDAHPVRVALRTGETQTGVFSTVAGPGDAGRRWWLGHARGLRAAAGDASHGAVWSFADITARKVAEESLQEQTRFMHAVLDNIAEGVIACDADGHLSLINEAAWELVGVPPGDLPLDDWARHFRLRHLDGTPYASSDLPLARALRGEVVQRAGVVVARPNGASVTLLSSARPLRAAGGDGILGAVVALQDVTEQRRLEAELRTALDAAVARGEGRE